MTSLTLIRDTRGDFQMHVTGCSDIKRSHVAQSRGDDPAVYEGATLLDAIVTADTDMAGWFCREPYDGKDDEIGETCWSTTNGVEWAPCFTKAVKAAGITFAALGRPTQKENPMTATATTKTRKVSRREAVASGKAKVAADVTIATVAAAPKVDPLAGTVLITLTERDRIVASKDKALITRVEAGTYVRPNGKAPAKPPKTAAGPGPDYYPRWRLAVALTEAMMARVETVAPDAEWGWSNPDGRKPRERKVREVRESAAGAPALDPVKVEKVRKAKAVIEAADALPGPESIIAIGSPEAQAALEVAAAASLGAQRDE